MNTQGRTWLYNKNEKNKMIIFSFLPFTPFPPPLSLSPSLSLYLFIRWSNHCWTIWRFSSCRNTQTFRWRRRREREGWRGRPREGQRRRRRRRETWRRRRRRGRGGRSDGRTNNDLSMHRHTLRRTIGIQRTRLRGIREMDSSGNNRSCRLCQISPFIKWTSHTLLDIAIRST